MKAFIFLFCLCSLGIPTSAIYQKSYERYQVLSVRAFNTAQIAYLNTLQNDESLNLDFFQVPCLDRDIEFMVPPWNIQQVRAALATMRIKSKIVVQDMGKVVNAERRRMISFAGRTIWETYLNLTQIDSLLNSLQIQYRSRMVLFPMGISVEGRGITGVRISSNVNGPAKSAIWIECLAHAREWISGAVCLGIIEILVRNYGNQDTMGRQATAMLNKFDWYFVPVLNPDGYQYSIDYERLWRKNRSRNFMSPCRGVDLNRNWNASHCGAGTSRSPCSSRYCGARSHSEPETRALQYAVEATRYVRAFFSIHSFSQLLLLPHGFANLRPIDYEELEMVGKIAMEKLRKVNGVSFQTGHAPQLVYVASGTSMDYFKLNGVKFSYTYELRPTSIAQGGFELPSDQIVPSVRETFASFFSFSEHIMA